jgi:hypothetical protein
MRSFVSIGLPVHPPFRQWLADRLDELAAIAPATGESVNGEDIADAAVELAGLLRSGGTKFSTEDLVYAALGEHLEAIGARWQDTPDGAFAETATYLGLWFQSLASDD